MAGNACSFPLPQRLTRNMRESIPIFRPCDASFDRPLVRLAVCSGRGNRVPGSDVLNPSVNPLSRGRARLQRIAELSVAALAVETIFSVPYRSLFLAGHSSGIAWAGALVLIAAVAFAYRSRERLLAGLSGLIRPPENQDDRAWLAGWVGGGLVLRTAWALLHHVPLRSDGLAYFVGARELAEQHSITGAFWPPGFSLLLAPFLAVFGASAWVALLVALLLFVATVLVTYRLGLGLGGRVTARLAVLFVALWPCHLTLAGVNSKETLLALLIPAAMLLYLGAITPAAGLRWSRILLAGLVTGFAALTQPAFLLFPAVILLLELVRGTPLLQSAGRTVLFSFALLAVVLPWTTRNYRQYHRLVLISTNGGSVFYRANNPKANASYAAEGEESLPSDEFAADKEGYSAARTWILHHPGAFTVLMVRKQVVYLGDDGIGVYESMKRDQHPRAVVYAAAKALSNLVWLAAWVLILFGLAQLFHLRNWQLWFGLCFLPQVYQWTIDSVFESGSRHHLGYISLVSVMVALVLAETRREGATRAHTAQSSDPMAARIRQDAITS